MQRVILIISDLAYLEPFFRKNFLLVLVLVYYLDRNLICRPKDIKSKDLLPAWRHAIRPFNDFGVLDLVLPSAHLLIDNDLDHWLKAIRIEKLVIKLSIHDIKSKS